MKKYLKVILSSLCLGFACLFTACVSPAQYLITTNPSDSSLGSVIEASQVNLNTKAEGSRITLTAKENTTTNPFICWIKDYKTVVAKDKQINLTYNAASAGNYTAVFSESTQNKMMFASLASVKFEIDSDNDEGYTEVQYNIQYAILSTGSENYSTLTENHFNLQDTQVNTDNRSVLYFGKVGANYEYALKVNVVLKNQSGDLTDDNFEFNTIDKSVFDGNGNYSASSKLGGFGTLTLNFEKLNKDMNFEF